MSGVGVQIHEARTIAAAISGKLKVTIKEGQNWAFNFKDNVITYRAADLKNLTRVEVIANLLHESGHARYSIDPRKVKYPEFVTKEHEGKVHFLINAIEDFRIEDLVRAFYPYAIDYLPELSFKTKYTLDVWQLKYTQARQPIPKFLQYCFVIYSYIAGYAAGGVDEDVMKVFDKTKDYALSGRYVEDNQQIADIVTATIYPQIKHWLDAWDDRNAPRRLIILGDGPPMGDYPSYSELYDAIKPLIKPTVEKFRRVLTDNLFDRYIGRYRTGPRIIQNKLYRHRSGDFNLFRRKLDAKSKDYVFALLVDESGSMRYGKAQAAAKSAILFAHVLNELNVPYGIYGFNAKFKKYKTSKESFGPRHHKHFESMMTNTDRLEGEYNNDAEALFLTTQELRGEESRKIILVLSDGYPAPSDSSIARGFIDLPLQVKRATKQGIETVGIGIRSAAVAEYYPTHMVVTDVAQIPQMVIQSLQRKLKD